MLRRKITQLLTATILLMGSGPGAFAQAPGATPTMDQVDHLALYLELTDEQQKQVRAIFDAITPQMETLQLKARELHLKVRAASGPDYDEATIRKHAAKMGKLNGEMIALSAILQSKVEARLTETQRQTLHRLQNPAQMFPEGEGRQDRYGRSPGDPHYGHDHP